jgi:hypothetical protein
MNRSLSHRPSFPPSPTRTPPSYASRCILECPLFLFFLAFALMNFRVFSPPQRKQVIGRFIQTAARFAVCLTAMSILSASLRATVSRLIFCFEAFRAGEPPGRPRNSASANCRFKNVFIFNVGRCARLAVRGREHSLTHRRAGTTNVDAAKIPHSPHKGWSAFFGWGIT